MRKTLSFLVCLSLLSSTIPGCTSKVVSYKPDKPKSEKLEYPFTFDYKTSKANAGFFVDGDTLNTVRAATPFYAGRQPLPQKTSPYDKARAAKVREIVKEADALVAGTDGSQKRLAALRLAYLRFLTTALKEEPKLKKYAEETFSAISAAQTKQAITAAQYRSIRTKTSDPFVKSFMQYLKVSKAMELGYTQLRDVSDIGSYAAAALRMVKDHKSPKIAKAAAKLDKQMQGLDELGPDLKATAASIQKVDNGIKQLKTADYHLSLETVNFIGDKLPDLRAKARGLKPRPGLTATDIKFVKANVNFLDEVNQSLRKEVENVDKTALLDVDAPVPPPGIAVAQAAEPGSDYQKSVAALNPPIASTKSGWIASGWNGIKAAVRGVKTGIGVGIDVAGITVRNVSQVGWGLYSGNKVSEIWDDMKNNTREITSNYQKGISGASTLKTAGEYVDGVETGAGEAAAGATESFVGKGWTSWGVGLVSKTTVGMFTGLGKGIYKLARTDATTGELAEGTIDVGFAFIGGSKVLIKASQVPGLLKGMGQSGKLLAQDGAQFWKQLVAGGENRHALQTIAGLIGKSKLTQAEAAELLKASAEAQIKAIAIAELQAARAALLKQLTEAMKQGGKEALEGSVAGIKQSLDDLLHKAFTNNIKGYREVLGTVVGTTGTEFIDNLVGSWTDDFIKGMVKEAVESGPEPGEVSGRWAGTLTINQVNEEALKKQSAESKDGCNIDMGDLKGKAMPISWDMAVGVDGKGTLTQADAAAGKAAPLTYEGGSISVDQTEGGFNTHLEGAVTRTDSGYAASGIGIISGGGTWIAKGVWKATKAK